jgi:anti-sigma factor ChrR (cupin superfamily)
LFAGIHADIKQARSTILKSWKRTANGSLSNMFGKAIAGDAKPEEQLAHLIQGVEALALQTAIKMHPNDIVLLQHDGFASTRRLSDKAIMEAVFQATGYRLELEEKTIRIDPDAQFLRNRNKLEIRPQPNSHAGLSLPPVS